MSSHPRHLVLLDQEAHPAAVMNHFRDVAGLTIGSCADISGPVTAQHVFPGSPGSGHTIDGYLLPRLGVVVVQADDDQVRALREHADDPRVDRGPILAIEQERAVWPAHVPDNVAPGEPPANPDESVSGADSPPEPPRQRGPADWPPPWFHRTPEAGIDTPWSTGIGVRVAVIDTGINVDHTDFAPDPTTPHDDGRPVYAHSVITDPGLSGVRDTQGHGTHLAGVAGGPTSPAPECELYSCKVFPDIPPDVNVSLSRIAALDGYLLSGIEWCVQHSVDIALLGCAARVDTGMPHSHVFEYAVRRALDHGVLVIAPAGNDSDRAVNRVEPVAHPANCPSVLAVGALAARSPGIELGWQVADYSNGTLATCGQVDVVAPGTIQGPVGDTGHEPRTGTSVAAAYVAGIAAVISGDTLARGRDLFGRVLAEARRLHQPATDVGAGYAFTSSADPDSQPRP